MKSRKNPEQEPVPQRKENFTEQPKEQTGCDPGCDPGEESLKNHPTRQEQRKRLRSLRFRLAFFVLLTMFFSGFCTMAVILTLHYIFGFMPYFLKNPLLLMVILFIPSMIIGTVLTALLGERVLVPIQELTDAAKKIGEGDFSVRVGADFGLIEISEMQKAFNKMAEDLGNIEVFRNDFVNNFSHEFKTPIVSIRGFAHELRYGDLSEEQKNEYLGIICKESDRLSQMASAVLLLSRFENQTIVSGKTVYDLDEQIRGCILMLERQWEAKGLELDIDLDEVSCLANEEMLSHVWVNLLGNAVKFTPDGGKIGVTLRRDGKYAEVRISDSGVGMSESVKAHIYEKFYQGDSSHRSEGNGIGLTLVHRIVVLCEGTISVESEEGVGTVFTVRLPVVA